MSHDFVENAQLYVLFTGTITNELSRGTLVKVKVFLLLLSSVKNFTKRLQHRSPSRFSARAFLHTLGPEEL